MAVDLKAHPIPVSSLDGGEQVRRCARVFAQDVDPTLEQLDDYLVGGGADGDTGQIQVVR
jgi:hypothetical protein